MEHLADKFNTRWFIRVRFLKVHDESEGAVLEWCIAWSNDYGVPM
jgi:hypothetical protein